MGALWLCPRQRRAGGRRLSRKRPSIFSGRWFRRLTLVLARSGTRGRNKQPHKPASRTPTASALLARIEADLALMAAERVLERVQHGVAPCLEIDSARMRQFAENTTLTFTDLAVEFASSMGTQADLPSGVVVGVHLDSFVVRQPTALQCVRGLRRIRTRRGLWRPHLAEGSGRQHAPRLRDIACCAAASIRA
jgi:hypothetical protein